MARYCLNVCYIKRSDCNRDCTASTDFIKKIDNEIYRNFSVLDLQCSAADKRTNRHEEVNSSFLKEEVNSSFLKEEVNSSFLKMRLTAAF